MQFTAVEPHMAYYSRDAVDVRYFWLCALPA